MPGKLNRCSVLIDSSLLHKTAGCCTNQSIFWREELYTDPQHIAFQQGLRAAVKVMGYTEDDDMSTMFER
jgi:hypothetical protein